VPVINEYFEVWDLVERVELRLDRSDRFIWRWMESEDYTASSAYRVFFVGMTALPGTMLMWRVATPPKVKMFFWITLHGRLWTAHRRQRHGLQDSYTCVLCDQCAETSDHLLAGCIFTREVWHRLLLRANAAQLAPLANSVLSEWWLASRERLQCDFHRAFDSLVLLVSWNIWKERNRRTFDRNTSRPDQVYDLITGEAGSWISVGYRSLARLFTAAA
jgi:hypothetical protein